MKIETQRALIAIGKRSIAITLPKAWVKYQGLKPGDSVLVTADRNITVTTNRRKGKGGGE